MQRDADSGSDGGAQPVGKLYGQLSETENGIKTIPTQQGCPLKDSSVRYKGTGTAVFALKCTQPYLDV